MTLQTGALDALLQEERRFPPPPDFLAGGPHVTDPDVYVRADQDYLAYWANWAKEPSGVRTGMAANWCFSTMPKRMPVSCSISFCRFSAKAS